MYACRNMQLQHSEATHLSAMALWWRSVASMRSRACSAQLMALPVPAEGMLLTQIPSSVACAFKQHSHQINSVPSRRANREKQVSQVTGMAAWRWAAALELAAALLLLDGREAAAYRGNIDALHAHSVLNDQLQPLSRAQQLHSMAAAAGRGEGGGYIAFQLRGLPSCFTCCSMAPAGWEAPALQRAAEHRPERPGGP